MVVGSNPSTWMDIFLYYFILMLPTYLPTYLTTYLPTYLPTYGDTDVANVQLIQRGSGGTTRG